MKPIMQFDDVCYSYRPGPGVLRGVDLTVDAGEIVGLLGRNGSGKTTLLHLAMGLLRPSSGDVRVFDLAPHKFGVAIKKRIGFVSEQQVLPPAMTVAQVMDYHQALFRDWDVDLQQKLLQRFPLQPNARVRTLSKGQARQLALLCSISHRPELLILDEPGGGLDPAARREFLEASIQLLNESGTTIFFSSHHMTDVERMASRIVLMEDGVPLIDAAIDELRENFCLVAVPFDGQWNEENLTALDSCLRARKRNSAIHAVFRGSSEEISAGMPGARCTALPLEEMFVELLGANS
ncbi:MAG: ABC transporter ATP-binding protein [Planctomycetes bacterium]|nr:ABC transporter ATP-binding protein [Planctomycetota bacterium]